VNLRAQWAAQDLLRFTDTLFCSKGFADEGNS